MKKYAPSLLVFVIAIFVLFFLMDRNLNIYDEGVILLNARRTLAGEIVHCDFYSPYGPGSYYALAAVFSVFGPSFLAGRLFGIVVHAGILAMLFAVLRHRVNAWIALGAATIGGLWFVANPLQYLYPTFPSALLMLAGAWCLLRPGAPDNRGMLLSAGACCGLAAYFRYDAGFFTMGAFMMAVVVADLARGVGGLSRASRDVALIASGAAFVFLPGAIAYLATSPITAFWADVVDNPLKYYARMRSLPFPRPNEILSDPGQFGVYLPIFAILVGLPTIIREIGELREKRATTMPIALLLGILSLILYYKGIVRVSSLHMILSIIPAIGLLAVLVDNWWRVGIAGRIAAVLVLIVTGISTAYAVVPQVQTARQMPERFVAGWLMERVGFLSEGPGFLDFCRSWPGMRLALLTPDDARIARYLATKTDQRERILVGLDRHDKVFVNAVALYFASNRLAGVHWAHYDPGIQTRRDIQEAIIDDLTRHDVRFVVRDARWDVANEPNDSAKSSGINVLDAYIEAHYRAIAKSGPIEIWLRDGVPAPKLQDNMRGCSLDAMVR